MRGRDRAIALPELDSLLGEGVIAGLPDSDLLERFISGRDRGGELAFTALMARHGPMVLGVCRRILRDGNEAEDAFQATFLVLAQKAGSIRLGQSLGPWLYGVSVKVARRLQSVASRRPRSLSQDTGIAGILDQAGDPREPAERRMDLDEALDALPVDFRAALWLCYFEGLTHEEAAVRLGCPVGTVRSRLARGRALLRQRLERGDDQPVPRWPRRSDPSAAAAGDRLPSPALFLMTARAAARLAAGHPLAGVAPARVTEVAAGVIQLMSRSRCIQATLLIAIGSLAGLGAWAAGQTGARGTAATAGRDAGRGASREIEQPPSNRLRGDFEAKVVRLQKEAKKPPGGWPAEFPPFVVETVPKLGDLDVDPSTVKEIRVVFSKPMMDQSWSWTHGDDDSYPERTGPIRYEPDQRTCVMPVKLEPGKTYLIGINGGHFNNFKAKDGEPALQMTIAFRTRAAKVSLGPRAPNPFNFAISGFY
jgi:RNA polymerase sigma-70 factor (ECF subfamily)